MTKLFLVFILLPVAVSSCGRDKSQVTTTGTARTQAGISSSQDKSGSTKSVCDSFPPMSQLGSGELSLEGMADVFKTVTGVPMDKAVTPCSGKYAVWNQKDYGNKNRSTVLADYTTTPEQAGVLIARIRSSWQAEYGSIPDFDISETKWDEWGREGIDSKTNFSPGTIVISVNNRYASFHDTFFKVILDVTSGNLHLVSYRGTEDTPGEREKPE